MVQRYDRISTKEGLRRVHQEDICQALGLPPSKKYEAEGGPGAANVVNLLERSSIKPQEDVESFVNALAFNWLIGESDGHAKNYSVLLSAAGAMRLAPLYDLASALAYPDIDLKKIKLAMKIGGSYRLRDIGRRNWEKLLSELRFTDAALINRLIEFATVLPDYIADTARQLHSEDLHHDLIDRMAGQLTSRAEDCLRVLTIRANGSDQERQ